VFQYPPEWTTADTGDKILGFRSLFIDHNVRMIALFFSINLPNNASTDQISEEPDQNPEQPEESDNENPDEEVDALKTLLLFVRITDDWSALNDELQRLLVGKFDETYRGTIIAEEIYMCRKLTTTDETMVYQNTEYWSYYNKEKVTPITDVPDTYGIQFRTTNQASEGMYFMITPAVFGDTKSMLHAETYFTDGTYAKNTRKINCIEFYDVWDRKTCAINSNIATGVQRNYLGHTNVRYDPLKYYRINNNDTDFSVELYIGHNNGIPVILPFDDKETLTMEYVILQNATELYT
jgi:hypothetical protein